ncbi:hypothetical protein F4775DRAFT_554976 [Biscogniauxia sp. FL1348]|nr:hypothetical protein F4775DRAFT_554976 [Biscogniauxia sp. FL1348]
MKRDPGRVMFDPLRDTLYFGARGGNAALEAQFLVFTKLVEPGDMSVVQHVAINEILIRDLDHILRTNPNSNSTPTSTSPPSSLTLPQVLHHIHASFTGLAQLTFVCHDRNPVYSADAVLVSPGQRNRLAERSIGGVWLDSVGALGRRIERE